MKSFEDHLPGISEVFGVMLMLTVTLIIACLVAAFATGYSFDSADDLISVSIVASGWGDNSEYVLFDHLSGDPVDLNSIEINLALRSSAKTKTVVSNRDDPTNDDIDHYIVCCGEDGDETTVTVGDRFMLYADRSDAGGVYWEKDGAEDSFFAPDGDYINYRIIDRRSGRAISAGSIPVSV